MFSVLVLASAMADPPTGASVMKGVQLLYNNDGENLWAVDSPYHKVPITPTGVARPSPITKAVIRGSARDVAHIADVDLICPFHNVPWWESKLEPPAQHRAWYDKTFGFPWGAGGSQLDFVLKGGDFIGEFADECTKTAQKPFVTIRLNDGQVRSYCSRSRSLLLPLPAADASPPQMCSHPPTPDNATSGVNNDHQFDRLSRFWYDSKTDPSIILGLQETPAEGWKPCCWGCVGKNHTPACKKCACKSAACELSFSNAKPRERIANLINELVGIYITKGVRGVELDFQRGLGNSFALLLRRHTCSWLTLSPNLQTTSRRAQTAWSVGSSCARLCPGCARASRTRRVEKMWRWACA